VGNFIEVKTRKTFNLINNQVKSFSFTIGFGYTDPHYTLTTIGRFCSYMLTFFGLLFNGLILQELIKGFLKISREERRDQ
jgi:hypothetical protein